MAYYEPLFKRNSILLEAPGDEGGGDAGGDAGGETADAAPEADTADAGDDNAGDDAGGGDDAPANEDNDDFNIDSSDDMGGGEDEGGDDTGGSSGGGGDNDIEQTEEAKEQDSEMYGSLTPHEMKLKAIELKKLYMKLYNRCDQIIKKYNDLDIEFEASSDVTKAAIDALYAIKDMISDYLLYIYDSKSYEENDIMFNRYLAALNGVKLITKELRTEFKDKIEDADKATNR